MFDQTSETRRLASPANHGHGMLVVSGGRQGVGATSLAVSLATTLAEDGRRVVLVDANAQQADVAARTNLVSGLGIGDVLAGRKTIHEVLQRGPAGMHVLAGTVAAELQGGLSARAIDRFLRQLRTLGPHADWLIVDAGNQPSELTARLWAAAYCVLLVTSPEAAAVMDAYALIKTLLSRYACRQAPALVVNQAADEAMAVDVHRRIDQSCQRFLGLSIEFAGGLIHDAAVQHGSAGLLAAGLARLAKRVFEAPMSPRAARSAA